MTRWSLILGWLPLLHSAIGAEVELNQDLENQQQCQGMYSKKSWAGNINPYISTTFRDYKPTGPDDPYSDPVLAVVIFEWEDYHLLGVPESEGSPNRVYICDETAIEANQCQPENIGTFILSANATAKSKSQIQTLAIKLSDPDRPAIFYPIERTGYYCISTKPFGDFKYTAITVFRNAYGELPGAQISKLPFYGGLAIVYAVVGAFWAFLYVQNRRDILAVQNYISLTIVFLAIEMIATWGYYDHMNRNGSDIGSNILIVVVAVLNAFRNSLSFFLLLIVCMGYGVVHSSLGKMMTYARILGVTHFVFGVIYAIASLSIAPEDAGPLVLLVVLPLAATLTAFYVWTLNALSTTTRDLVARKQRVKATMYRRLWWLILGSVLVIFAFFFLNSLTFTGQSDPDFTPTHWQTRWFVLDGWLNLVYLVDVCVIAYIWRPTANNRRFAMSEELSQDDDNNFEIASLHSSIDLERSPPSSSSPSFPSDPSKPSGPSNGLNGSRKSKHSSLPSDSDSDDDDGDGEVFGNGYAKFQSAPPPGATSNSNPNGNVARRDSPLPAPRPTKPISTSGLTGTGTGVGASAGGHSARSAEEGETIFAVGDEDDDDEDDDENSEGERGKLTGGKKI